MCSTRKMKKYGTLLYRAGMPLTQTAARAFMEAETMPQGYEI